jgi:hypothetical protein
MSMQPILDLITERQAATSAAADTLREQISKLTDELRLAEAELADLTTTRTTLTRLTSQNEAATSDDTTAVSTVYQQIIAVFDTATGALRAKDICRALGIGIEPKATEGVRAKLKRLVKRQVLTETEPGLFTLAAPAAIPPAQPASSTSNPGPTPERT